MELWNKKDLCAPPNNSAKIKSENIDIIHLKEILNGALDILEKKLILYKEAALLSRYIYRSKLRMRGHKSSMCLEKVNRGLRRYLSLNLEHVYRNFHLMITHQDEEWVYVPSKQMLQFLLVRTQGFCKLMYFLATSCQSAAFIHREMLVAGHVLHENLLCLGIVSRIWCFARYYIICACQWYSQLHPYLEKLLIVGLKWLPAEYELPDNLKQWLEPDGLLGELPYDANVQKISNEISDKKDTGVLINREQFQVAKKIGKNPSGGKELSTSGFSRNDKTSVTDKNPKLNYENYFVKSSESKTEVIEIEPPLLPNCLGVVISRDNFFSETMGFGNLPVVRNYGLSRSVSDDLKTTKLQQNCLKVATESENVKLFLSTVQELCESSDKKANYSRDSISEELLLSSGTKRKCSVEESEVKKHLTFRSVNNELSSKQTVENTPRVLGSSYDKESKDTYHSDFVNKSNSFIEKFSADHEANICNTNHLAKKQNAPLGSWKIVNGIKTMNDLKMFLQSEKKARAKRERCISSELGKSEWNALIDAINKILKKKTALKSKQNKTNKLMEEIRSTLTSFLV